MYGSSLSNALKVTVIRLSPSEPCPHNKQAEIYDIFMKTFSLMTLVQVVPWHMNVINWKQKKNLQIINTRHDP